MRQLTAGRPERIVVVGAGLAGLRTAERLRRLGYGGALTVVGDEDRPSYDRPPLSKSALTDLTAPPTPLLADGASAELDLDLRRGVSATALNPPAHQLSLSDGSTLHYDRLVIATGARARRMPGLAAGEHMHVLRTWADLERLRTRLHHSGHLTVIGGGVLGGEIAATARGLSVEVTLIEAAPTLLARAAGQVVGTAVAALHRKHGVDVRLGTGVESIGTDEAKVLVRLVDGSEILTDNVVAAIGSTPCTDWLDGSGLAISEGILCDEFGSTSDADVFAVGDVARMPHPGSSEPVRLEHWTSAGDTAALIAANVLADRDGRRPMSEVPYFWSDFYGVKLQGLGIPSVTDTLELLEGDIAQWRFLAASVQQGRIQAVIAAGMPAALMRCRALVATGTRLADARATTPWERKRKVEG